MQSGNLNFLEPSGPLQACNAKPSQAKVLTGGGDLREAQVERPPVC